MTVTELMNEVQSKTNKPLNILTFRRRINEAIDFFSSMYDRMFIKDKVIIDCTDTNTYYDIPASSIGISKVLDSKDNKYTNFNTFNNSIKFENIDTFTVIYTVKANLENTRESRQQRNEVINVNPLFIRPIFFYILSLIEDDPNKSANYFSNANKLAQEANFMAKKQDRGKQKIMPMRIFR